MRTHLGPVRGLGLALLIAAVLPLTPARADLPAGTFVLDNYVDAIATAPDGSTYVGGAFTGQRKPTGAGLALGLGGTGEPDPTTFPAVTGGSVLAVVPDGSNGWYIGGTFERVGAVDAPRLAHIRRTGGVLVPDPSFAPRPGAAVNALARSGNTLYLGGAFTTVGDQARARIAAVDATSGALSAWNPGAGGTVNALAATGTAVYAAGTFTDLGGQPRARIGAVDALTGLATAWDPGAGDAVNTLVVNGGTVYAGGAFTTLGGQARNRIGAVDTTTGAATSWNPGASGTVYGMALEGSDLYVGGSFATIGGASRQNVAALTTLADTNNAISAWNPGVDGTVRAIATAPTDRVFVVGQFTMAGDGARPNFAQFIGPNADSAPWSPNPAGPGLAVAATATAVYGGGSFVGAGAPLASVSGIARLDPTGALDTTWNPAADGLVTSLALSGSTLYAGGSFLNIGGASRNRIAALDTGATATATSFNPNAGAAVQTLTVSGGTIYVGGSFTSIGGQPRNGIAALDASGAATSWNPNATPTGSRVNTIVVSGNTVYVGGAFTAIGGQARNRIAALDTLGSATGWNPGADAQVTSIVDAGSVLYVGGNFTAIGGQSRNRIAALDLTGNATSFTVQSDQAVVNSLALQGDKLYMAGNFTSAGGAPARGLVAVTTGSGAVRGWNPDVNGSVFAVTVSGERVLAGGTFTRAGEQTVPQVASFTDAVAPSVAVTVPAEGAHYTQGATVASAFACDDGPDGWGVANCDGPSTVDTTTAGARTFTVTASDWFGRTADRTVAYVVDPAPVVDPPAPPAGGGTTPAPPAGSTPAPVPAPTATPGGPLFAATGSVTAKAQSARKVRKAKVLVATASSTGPASFRITASVTAAVARTLRLSPKAKKPVTIATGTAKLTAGGRRTVRLKLTRAALRALTRVRSSTRVTLTVTVSQSGRRTVTRTARMTLTR